MGRNSDVEVEPCEEIIGHPALLIGVHLLIPDQRSFSSVNVAAISTDQSAFYGSIQIVGRVGDADFPAAESVFENTYFTFFFRFQKNMIFLRFFKMTYQNVVKSHNQVSSLLNVYRNFGLKTPGCYGYL